MLKKIALTFVVLANLLLANNDEWVTNGPVGGHIYTIVSSSDGNLIWCGTKSSGIFRSTNGGRTWTSANNGITMPTSIAALSISKTNENILYAGSSIGRIYKSTNGGETWNLTGADSTGFPVNSLAIDPTNSDVVYAARRGLFLQGGLFKTIDGGSTWKILENGLPVSNDTRAVTVHPDSSKVVYVGIYGISPWIQGGVYKSTNSGESWTAVNTGLSNISIISLAIDSIDGKTVYAGTGDGGIYRTTNAGSNWSVINVGIDNKNIKVVFVDKTGIVYSGAEGGGIYKSVNRGESWNKVNTGLANLSVWSISAVQTNTNIIYAGTKGGGIYKTNNGGSFWSANNTGLTAAIINDIRVNKSNATLWAATDGNGVFKSSDEGLNWLSASNGLPNMFVQSLAVDPSNDAIVYCGTSNGQIFKTVDGGINWVKISADSTGLPVYSIVINPSNSSIVYTARQKSNSPSILKTTDAGTNWIELSAGLPPSPDVRALVINPSNTNIIYTAIWGFSPFIPGGIFKSKDGGNTWVEINNGLTNVSVSSLVISSADTNTLLAGTAQGGGIFKTTDAGHNWVSQGLSGNPIEVVSTIALNPTNEKIIFAGTSSNLYESIDSGNNWDQINGVFQNLSIKSALVTQSRIYVGTDGMGVYTKQIVTSVKDFKQGIPENFALLQNYPNPFNPETIIKYQISSDSYVAIKIFNVLGEEIRSLVNANHKAGEYSIKWDGKDNFGTSVSSGIYIYRIESGQVVLAKKMMLIK